NSKQVKPANLHSHEAAECTSYVKVRASRVGELGGNLGNAQYDDGHAQRRKQHCQWTGPPKHSIQLPGHAKYPTSDHAIEQQSSHRPAADEAKEGHCLISRFENSITCRGGVLVSFGGILPLRAETQILGREGGKPLCAVAQAQRRRDLLHEIRPGKARKSPELLPKGGR